LTREADEGDMLSSVVGEPTAVRAAFDQLPGLMLSLAGPDHRVTAVNSGCRAFLGRSDLVGLPLSVALPELVTQQVSALLDRVYRTGQAETGRAWRVQLSRGSGELPADAYLDFEVRQWRDADGSAALVLAGTDVTAQVQPGQAARQHAAAAGEHAAAAAERYQTARDVISELQEALLPLALPVLPQARIAARYLAAGQDQAPGGDWFDALSRPDGTVVLIVGDVVGGGIVATAAMAQLRAVLNELLAAEPDLGTALDRADRFAARLPALRAATLALAQLDPATGALRYATCGHPPPLIVAGDGSSRFLPLTPGGPLGTGAAHQVGTGSLLPGQVLLLYSDGLVERPDRSLSAGMAELADVAAAAAASQVLPEGSAATAAERVCQLAIELLTRTGYSDDVTALAAERLAEPVPELHLRLPAEVASLTAIRRELRGWLARLDALADDQDGVHMAVVETVTNAIEHAYPPGDAGPIEFDLRIRPDGQTECVITDYGTWRPPDPAAADRGNGLMVAEHMVDQLQISHPASAEGAPAGAAGTVVRLLHRIRSPATVIAGASARPRTRTSSVVPFSVTTDLDGRLARAWVRGRIDIATADEFGRRLLAACRGGTLPLRLDLSGVTELASAGVGALYHLLRQLAAHGSRLELLVQDGGAVQAVLQVVDLPATLMPPATTGA
jgi:serine phosphatase RsbU (regulator of sigma subunit)/anti-sigma regulatory factor (Ser/Thr protein kinase)/ABC-type transporter Mla MlaB component